MGVLYHVGIKAITYPMNEKYQITDSEELLEFKRRVDILKNNPEKLNKVLIDAGIIDENRKLTEQYTDNEL